MDFRSLSRRQLQALCKRNKIPANITNVAMADALAALPSVEGMEEFLNGDGSGVPESPMKEEFVNSEIPRTALRTSTRRKTVKDEPITTRTRRAAAARGTEESENRDLNVALTTPPLPSGRKRTGAVSSACKKVDFQMTVDVVEKENDDLDQEENVIEKTPAVPKSQKRVAATSTRRRTETRNNGTTEKRVYSTRRSARLLEKNMEDLSLGEDEKMEPITVHMSFDEMPNRTGPVKEDTSIEIESKKTYESESKLDEDFELEIENQEKNKLESEVKVSEIEQEMNLDSFNCSAENLVTGKCDDSETEAPDHSLNVKCFPEVEKANEASKDDDDAVEISAEEINDSDKFSLPTEGVDLTEVHNSSLVEDCSKELELNESICESECVSEEDSKEEAKLMNISAELSLAHENVEEEIQVDELIKDSTELSLAHEEEETQVDDVLSSVKESVMEVKDDDLELEQEEALDADIEGDKKEMEMETISVQVDELIKDSTELSLAHEKEETQVDDVLSSVKESVMEVKDDDLKLEQEEALDADIEGDKKEMEMETISVQTELDDTVNSMDFPENVSEELVDVKIQCKLEEAPKDVNVDAVDSQPEIPNDIQCEEEEALVEVSVTSTEEVIPTSSNININGVQPLPSIAADQLELANQFPRPTVETKSPLKDQTIKLLIDNPDAEEDEVIPTSSNININGVQPLPPSIAAADQLEWANQFPRPTVETKSPVKDQTIKLLIDNSDAEEDEDEKEQEKANCIQSQLVEKNDMSLRQLRKMFKEQLQLSKKKKMDTNNNTKVVVGGGKVRTALQPVPENIMGSDELEKRF